MAVRVLICQTPDRQLPGPALVYWNEEHGWGRFDAATRYEGEREPPEPNWPGAEVTWRDDLAVDLDGFWYVVDEHIGPWRVTHCCGAATSINDGPMYCKSCYGEVGFEYDTPARLDANWQPGNGPVRIQLPPNWQPGDNQEGGEG